MKIEFENIVLRDMSESDIEDYVRWFTTETEWSKTDALCYVEGNEVAKHMYEKFGFVETERDGDEIVMERTL